MRFIVISIIKAIPTMVIAFEPERYHRLFNSLLKIMLSKKESIKEYICGIDTRKTTMISTTNRKNKREFNFTNKIVRFSFSTVSLASCPGQTNTNICHNMNKKILLRI
ncbi:MAG: hypothetical protein LBE13_12010 [Bacteroidales bacterium]|nr:hypothetical protein [Bacteroidales bacterium]